MPFRFRELELPGVVLIEPAAFPDERGFFMETYKRSEFAAHGIGPTFVQDNHSHSAQGTLRGLHYQRPPKAQGKLVRAVVGEVFDAVVDLRKGSPSYGRWLGVTLSAQNKSILYVPPWCAHGFYVLSAEADVVYKVTEEYAPELEAGLVWNDADIGIAWPGTQPLLSGKDRSWPRLKEADAQL